MGDNERRSRRGVGHIRMPLENVVVAGDENDGRELNVSGTPALRLEIIIGAEGIGVRTGEADVSRRGTVGDVECQDEIPTAGDGGFGVVHHEVVDDAWERTARASFDVGPLVGSHGVGTPEVDATVAAQGLRVGISLRIINKLQNILVGIHRTGRAFADDSTGDDVSVHVLKRNDGLDGVRPIDSEAIDVRRREGLEAVLEVGPIRVRPVDRRAGRGSDSRGGKVINLRHHGVAPETKFLVGKRSVNVDDRKRRVREKFVRPVGADG